MNKGPILKITAVMLAIFLVPTLFLMFGEPKLIGPVSEIRPNSPPFWNSETSLFNVDYGSALTLDLDDYFSDKDKDPLNYMSTSAPSMQISIDKDKAVFSPLASGQFQVSLFASDGKEVAKKKITIIAKGEESGSEASQPQSSFSQSPEQEPKRFVDNEVKEKLASQEEVEVIISLPEMIPAGFAAVDMIEDPQKRFDAKLEMKKDQVSAQQEELLKLLSSDKFKLTRKYSTFGSVAGTITKEGLAELERIGNFDGVYSNRVFEIERKESIPLINADDAWKEQVSGINITGTNVAICILDTGYSQVHYEFEGRVPAEYCYCNAGGTTPCCPGGGTEGTNASDDHGHGTHVAGIALGYNRTAPGVAPGAYLIPIKVCNSGGSCEFDDIIAGVDWCTDNASIYNISVISMSIGDGGRYNTSPGYECPDYGFDAPAAAATSQGIIIVAASGNNGFADGINSPACEENVTSVGAVTKADGIIYNRGDLLDVLAPGDQIISARPPNITGSSSGTSMATPHAAGAAALLIQYQKLAGGNVTPSYIRDLMKITGKAVSGYPRVDVLAALLKLKENVSINQTSNSAEKQDIGQVKFSSSTDFANYSGCINISNNSIFINSTRCPEFNKSAEIRIEGLEWVNARALRDGAVCPSNICENQTYSGGVLTFNVSYFSSYSANGTSRLEVWDDSDFDTIFENQTTNFYANFTNSTGPSNTTDGGCKIQLDTGGGYGAFSDMTYNGGSQLFNYTANFTDNGAFNFNVSCSGVDNLDSEDSFVIAQVPPILGILSCLSRTTACLAGEVDVLGMSNYTNAHAELGNESGYSYRICCQDTTGRNDLYTNATGHYTTLLNLSGNTNAHAELPNETAYTFAQYFGADADKISCGYTYTNGTCSGNSVCVATLSNYTNAHVANCSQENYNLTTCCEISQLQCGDTVTANLTLQSNVTNSGVGTCYTVAADNIVINCSGYSIIGDNAGLGIDISGRQNVTIVDCDVRNFTDGIAVDPSYNIIIQDSTITANYDGITFVNTNNSIIRNNNIFSNSDDGVEAWNSSLNIIQNNTFSLNGGNGIKLWDCRYNNLTNNTFAGSGKNNIELISSDSIRISPISFGSYNFSSAGVILQNVSAGELRFLNTSITQAGTNIAEDIQIISNNVFVNSSAKQGINVSANITLYGLSFSIPLIEFDLEDDGSFAACTSLTDPACYNLSYSGGTFVFNTTHFTTFRTSETNITPPNVTLLSPANNTINTTSNMIYFNYNVSDADGIANCSLVIDSIAVITNDTIDQAFAVQTFNYSISNGQHSWRVNCTDNSTSYNIGASEIRLITASYNRTPIFNNSNLVPNVTFAEDSYNDTINLSEHFYDLDNDSLYYSGSAQGVSFSFNNVTGRVNITGNANFTGVRYVVFSASDTISSNTSNNVTINITPVNDAPHLDSSIPTQSWTQDTNRTLDLSDYFEDVDGDDLNYSVNTTKSSTANITITIYNNNKTVLFAPDSGITGTRYVTFIANDSLLTAESNNVTLTVNAPSSGGGGGSYTPPTTPPPVTPPVQLPVTPPAPTPPAQPPAPAPAPLSPTLEAPANIERGGSPNIACTYSTKEGTEIVTTEVSLGRKIKVPSGYEIVVNPFNVNCPTPEYEITLNVPQNYEDLKALRCGEDECRSITETRTVVEEMICGGKVISELRKETLTKREKEYAEPTEFRVVLESGKRITPAETMITTGGFIVQFSGIIPSDLYTKLKRPERAIAQPKNPSLTIVGTPLIVEIDTLDKSPIPATVIIPFTPTNNTEENSLAIHALKGGKWEYVESKVDKEARRVTANISDINKYLEEGEALFAVIGVVCEACTSARFEKIYQSAGSRDAVILVHGFSSSPKTFQLLIDEFSYNQQPWQIWTLAYPSDMGIDTAADELAAAIESHASEYDNIYLVGHSMGSLIIQQALHNSYTERQANPALYSYIEKVRKAVLIGAPNDGSPAAEVYKNLYTFFMNEETAAKLFNFKSSVIDELVKGRNTPQVPDIGYYVIAGTYPYEFNAGIFKLSAQQLLKEAEANDGIVTLTSAQHIGSTYINNMCADYWEINVSHTDLLDNPASRKVIERILSESIAESAAERGEDKALVGFNQYFKIKVSDCSPQDTYIVIGRKIDEEKAYNPLLECSCGNGYCGTGENEANCPTDCATIIRTETLSFLLPALIYLVLLITLFSAMVYGIIRDYMLKPVSAAWNFFIRGIITFGILLMFIHALIFGPTLYYSYLIEVFVIMYLAVGAEIRKNMLAKLGKLSRISARAQTPVQPARPAVSAPQAQKAQPAQRVQPAQARPASQPAPKKFLSEEEDVFDKMAKEFEEWKIEKRKGKK